jgi:hypothetical protein
LIKSRLEYCMQIVALAQLRVHGPASTRSVDGKEVGRLGRAD